MEELKEWCEGYFVNLLDVPYVKIEVSDEDNGVKFSDLGLGETYLIDINCSEFMGDLMWSDIKDDVIPFIGMLDNDWNVFAISIKGFKDYGREEYCVNDILNDEIGDRAVAYIWIVVNAKKNV
jgi:hypothetical protein